MIINARHISKRYNHHTALSDVSVSIPSQSIFGLLGPNGAGKTTLIRILTQITTPDSGSIDFNGQPLRPEHVYEMGYLPEERGLYKKMQVAEQLLYFAQLKGLSQQEAKARLKHWADRFDIRSWMGKKVEELSKGMQQKVQFIATVLHNPRLIILDEPFSGFDPINAQLLVDEILHLRKQGATIIFSTHRMDSVELLCSHIALINESRKVLDGEVNTVKNQYKTNAFRVEYDGNALQTNDVIDVVENSQNLHGAWNATIRSKMPISANELIKYLIGQVSIHSFTEKMPSMEEIFISAVNGGRASNSQ
jgi:ABC-2 type transport system ATP-binding protein